MIASPGICGFYHSEPLADMKLADVSSGVRLGLFAFGSITPAENSPCLLLALNAKTDSES